jgi:hypothetical protein
MVERWRWRAAAIRGGAAAARGGVPNLVDEDVGIVVTFAVFVEGDVVWYVARRFDLDHDKESRVVMAAHSPMLDGHERGEATDR